MSVANSVGQATHSCSEVPDPREGSLYLGTESFQSPSGRKSQTQSAEEVLLRKSAPWEPWWAVKAEDRQKDMDFCVV